MENDAFVDLVEEMLESPSLSELPLPPGVINSYIAGNINSKKATKKQRLCSTSVLGEMLHNELDEKFLSCQLALSEFSDMPLDNNRIEEINLIVDYMVQLRERYKELYWKKIIGRLRRNTNILRFETAEELYEQMGPEQFKQYFKLNVDCIKKMSSLLFAEGIPTNPPEWKKTRTYHQEFYLLLVLGGLNESFYNLEKLFGVAQTTLLDTFKTTILYLDTHFSPVVRLDSLKQLRGKVKQYRRAFSTFLEGQNQEVRERYNQVCCIVDGLRIAVLRSRNKEIRDALYSGYTKDYNLLFLCVS